MKEPVLVIMAAGMGSRYGGLKQIDKMTEAGEIILDFSMYDAMMAGFKKVVFVIREEMEDDLRALMEDRAAKYLDIAYAFQKLDDLPEGYEVPEGREKPWGTSHAILSCRDIVDGPFAVINADDYYGSGAFGLMYEFLLDAAKKDEAKQDADGKDAGETAADSQSAEPYSFSMVGYKIENTLTDYGHVSRGVCEVDENHMLTDINERKKIQWLGEKIGFTLDDGQTWEYVERGTPVSMNFWGFTADIIEEMKKGFPTFLDDALASGDLKAEYLLPTVVVDLIKSGKATVKVLTSGDRWFGVTYPEDKEEVVGALQSMKDKGLYPDVLWSGEAL